MGDCSSASSRRGEKRKLEEEQEDSAGSTPAASVASARRHLNDPADEVTMKTSVKKLLVEGSPHQPLVPNAHSLAKGEEKLGDGVGVPLAFTAPPPIQNNKDAVKQKKKELESQAAVYRKLARKSFQIHISLLNTTVSRTVVLPACKAPLFFFFSSLSHLSNDNPILISLIAVHSVHTTALQLNKMHKVLQMIMGWQGTKTYLVQHCTFIIFFNYQVLLLLLNSLLQHNNSTCSL